MCTGLDLKPSGFAVKDFTITNQSFHGSQFVSLQLYSHMVALSVNISMTGCKDWHTQALHYSSQKLHTITHVCTKPLYPTKTDSIWCQINLQQVPCTCLCTRGVVCIYHAASGDLLVRCVTCTWFVLYS